MCNWGELLVTLLACPNPRKTEQTKQISEKWVEEPLDPGKMPYPASTQQHQTIREGVGGKKRVEYKKKRERERKRTDTLHNLNERKRMATLALNPQNNPSECQPPKHEGPLPHPNNMRQRAKKKGTTPLDAEKQKPPEARLGVGSGRGG